jgi:hypothetical protein
MKIAWYRLLDTLQSWFNKIRKEIKFRRKWGEDWRNKERSGRRYSRVEAVAEFLDGPGLWSIRPEPGWEWTCQNCKSYSIITESMMPVILQSWEEMARDTVERGYKPPARPTAATAGCPECRYRPGAPE